MHIDGKSSADTNDSTIDIHPHAAQNVSSFGTGDLILIAWSIPR